MPLFATRTQDGTPVKTCAWTPNLFDGLGGPITTTFGLVHKLLRNILLRNRLCRGLHEADPTATTSGQDRPNDPTRMVRVYCEQVWIRTWELDQPFLERFMTALP